MDQGKGKQCTVIHLQVAPHLQVAKRVWQRRDLIVIQAPVRGGGRGVRMIIRHMSYEGVRGDVEANRVLKFNKG